MESSLSRTQSVHISLISYGHANGPVVQQPREEARHHQTLAYNIRHLPNPPRHLRVKATGLSRRLQKEFLQNDAVEAFLVKVQRDIVITVEESCAQPLCSTAQEGIHEGASQTDTPQTVDDHSRKEPGVDGTEVVIVVTICCEEGRHRSVAFVEELARRLATVKDGDGVLQRWVLNVGITHRDIETREDCEQPQGRGRRPNKGQAQTRQRERRQKGNWFGSRLEDEDNTDQIH
ncbi:hypothetical protein ASPACDRAFT_120263 [Aspergillus aculeatus ATCC 16872]|uniref:RapZ C-terminal domain-containing protein n=1 Tax=Aspergillus aculeatus (strain ATCC 16872 / CBS 172.66 / WB 5094) TaxID=690307 RepID=A0A1L9WSI1_ASPA1|nr:uncharacterized protein ASPACDRAFT_120263 [Aspergillus aculeatus ATCC 16872]OJJ99131.1 hypothetical protein ASPACDRAFT_120263 [Aspergillus aculeatus ATCC 16872]